MPVFIKACMITRVKDNVRFKTTVETVWQGFYSRTTKLLAIVILKIKVLIAFIFIYGILAIFKISLKNSAKVIHYM